MHERIQKVREFLQEKDLDALMIDHPIDLFYLTGQELSLGRFIIEKENMTLFVDGRYYEGCRDQCRFPVLLTSGYSKESSFGKWWKFEGKKVGFDADSTSYSEYQALLLLEADWIPLKSPILHFREIKEPDEITFLSEAAKLGSEGFDFACTLLGEGITEKEVAQELEIFWLKKGGDKLAFAPHIAFGEGSAHPHYHSGSRKLKTGDPILIDIGVVLNHYYSDMTRVLFFGEPSPKLKEIYTIVYEAQAKAFEKCRPGVSIHKVDQAARDWIGAHGYRENFTHSLGHGVGLQIHELPRVRALENAPQMVLKEGMVITIEPGIYLPGIGGVRLEDTIVITKEGYKNLTQRSLTAAPPIIISHV